MLIIQSVTMYYLSLILYSLNLPGVVILTISVGLLNVSKVQANQLKSIGDRMQLMIRSPKCCYSLDSGKYVNKIQR